jgi:hypothetical protein
VRQFLAKLFLIASTAALAVGTGGGVSAAQTLPPGVLASMEEDPVVQLMLSAEASAVAQFLEIPLEQLEVELSDQSLAQVTRNYGKSIGEVTSVVVATAHQQLDDAVNGGQLSAEAAAQYKFQIAFLAPMLVNSKQASQMALRVAGT